RQKDVIIGPSGMNIYPEDMERVLDQLPGVKESCVVGAEQEERLRLVGFVLLRDGAAWDPQALLARANEQLASHQRLQAIERWPEPDFPRTRTLKVKRSDILALLRGVTPAGSPAQAGAAGGDELLLVLRECL